MTENLIFSNFNDREFDAITDILCNLFVTTKSELRLIYEEIIDDFNKDGWPSHFVNREFFHSCDREFRETINVSPSVAIDLPSLFEFEDEVNNKPTIVIIGQDPKSNEDFEKISLGTPYGLHHKGSREVLKRTKLYFDMITILLRIGYRVYLTDVYKIWVCDPDKPYNGMKLPKKEQDKLVSVLKSELLIMKPIALVTWGKEAEKSVADLNLDIQHLKFPHPSGAANGSWKKLINQSPTNQNKLAYWETVMSNLLT